MSWVSNPAEGRENPMGRLLIAKVNLSRAVLAEKGI